MPIMGHILTGRPTCATIVFPRFLPASGTSHPPPSHLQAMNSSLRNTSVTDVPAKRPLAVRVSSKDRKAQATSAGEWCGFRSGWRIELQHGLDLRVLPSYTASRLQTYL